MRASGVHSAVLAAAGLLAAGTAAAPPEAAGPAQDRGRRIYLESRGSSAPIVARLGGSNAEIPAEALTCGDCHGRDGKGTTEGGVAAPDIRWSALSRETSREETSGPGRPAFDRASLGRTVTRGIDPAGRPLHPAMPRYRMAASDLEDLLDYLQHLGTERPPGVTGSEILVGTLLPLSGPMADAGLSVREALSAYIEALNADGGIHGRRLRLAAGDAAGPGGAIQAHRSLDREGVFCLVAALTPAEESDGLAGALRADGVPLLGPVRVAVNTEMPPNPYVFDLLPGVGDQVRALVSHVLAASREGLAIAADGGPIGDAARRAFAEEMGLHGAEPAAVVPITPGAGSGAGVVEALRVSRPAAVLVAGAPSLAIGAASALRRASWRPRVLSLAALTGRRVLDLSPEIAAGITLAYAGPLPEEEPEALASFGGFLRHSGVRQRHAAFQLLALAAAQVLAEGLKRTGRELSREGLIRSLEALQDFPTILGTSVSFGPNERIGSRSLVLVRPDPATGRFVKIREPGSGARP